MYNPYTDRDLMALFAAVSEFIRPYYPIPPGRKIDPDLALGLRRVTTALEKTVSACRAKPISNNPRSRSQQRAY
jgi:hypothetical protein